MPGFRPPMPVALRTGQNFLPESAKFEGLVLGQGRGTVQIRFLLGDDRTLDIRPSAGDLTRLARALSGFVGLTPPQVREQVERLAQSGELLDP
jgi:hypothetical protein